MAIKMQTSSLLRAFKLAPNRQSNWARHLNQSKSIRLRPRRATSIESSCLIGRDKQLLEQQQKQALGDLGRRVSINHVGVDHDEAQLNEQRGQLPMQATTSGTQLPMISPEEESKSLCDGQQKNHNLRRSSKRAELSEDDETTTVQVKSYAQRHGICWQPSPATVMLASVMVVSIVCAATLIGPCNCDTLNGHNSFKASRVEARQQQVAGGSKAGQSLKRSAKEIIERRNDATSRQGNMDELISSIERQHNAGDARNVNFRPVSTQQARPTRNHDDLLRNILASHESGGPKSSSGSPKPLKRQFQLQQPTGDKADYELRKIMLMHEQAAAPPSAGATKSQSAKATTSADYGSAKATATKWPAAIKSILPKELLNSSKASLMSIVPAQILNGRSPALFMKAASSTSSTEAADQLDQHRDGSSSPTSVADSPFTQRASAKNYLMGSILGMGQMLMSQPPERLAAATESSRPDEATNEIYSKPANEFKLFSSKIISKPKNYKSSWPTAASSQAERPRGDQLKPVATMNSESEQTDSHKKTASEESSSGSTGWRQSTSETTKPKVGTKKSWLVDDATNLAQAYIRDSLRDLLTLTQLPIFSDAPVSSAPSELEPGGRKWLANKKAAEQMRGNRTNAIEDLLRYVYILGNVGVRRKRDPLKALGSDSHSGPLSVLAHGASKPNKRPNLSLLASTMAAAASANGRPAIGSLIKFRPPNKIASSKLSSLFTTNRDHIKSRGVMWDMATDPTLAVTMLHLLEQASVALPLGFLLMPFVRMTRHPLGGFDMGSILPPRASHRSVDFEELAKRLDMDRILSRSMRSAHRNAPSFMG